MLTLNVMFVTKRSLYPPLTWTVLQNCLQFKFYVLSTPWGWFLAVCVLGSPQKYNEKIQCNGIMMANTFLLTTNCLCCFFFFFLPNHYKPYWNSIMNILMLSVNSWHVINTWAFQHVATETPLVFCRQTPSSQLRLQSKFPALRYSSVTKWKQAAIKKNPKKKIPNCFGEDFLYFNCLSVTDW